MNALLQNSSKIIVLSIVLLFYQNCQDFQSSQINKESLLSKNVESNNPMNRDPNNQDNDTSSDLPVIVETPIVDENPINNEPDFPVIVEEPDIMDNPQPSDPEEDNTKPNPNPEDDTTTVMGYEDYRQKNTIGRLKKGDLLVLHSDHAGDRGDTQSQVVNFAMVEKHNLNPIVVTGTYGNNKARYLKSTEAHMDLVWGSENWLNADKNWQDLVKEQAQLWAYVLRKGSDIWVSEGGQSDFTADIVAEVSEILPSANLKKIHVIQNNQEEEKKSDPNDLNYVKRNTDYILIEDGNKKNKTPNFNHKPQDRFMRIVSASSYKRLWQSAFGFLDPKKNNLDFSDSVNFLYILDISKDDVSSMITFGENYL